MNWSDEISVNDLTGGLTLPLTQVDASRFVDVINEVCEIRLRWILGDTFYDIFKANFDLEVEPETPVEGEVYQDADLMKLWNGGSFSTLNGTYNYDGLKKMCTLFSYIELINNGYMTLTGQKQSDQSNATNADGFRFNTIVEKRKLQAVSIHAQTYDVLYSLITSGVITSVEYKHYDC